jgi:hypothetical protein
MNANQAKASVILVFIGYPLNSGDGHIEMERESMATAYLVTNRNIVVWKARILDNLENNALKAFSQGFRASAIARHWLTLKKIWSGRQDLNLRPPHHSKDWPKFL